MPTGPRARLLGLTSAVAFAAFPLVRPWGDTSGDPQAMVDAFASPRWLIAHSLGMLAWVLLAATLVSVASGADRWSRASAWIAGIGAAAILPYYGSETFGLHGLATAAGPGDTGLVDAAQEAIRNGAVAATCFAVGLILLATAGVLVAIDTWRSSMSRRWLAVPLGVVLAAYLPQFFTPAVVRQLHGVALALAIALWLLLRDEGRDRTAFAESAGAKHLVRNA